MSTDEEFWRLPKVIAATGLSRSEIYRQMADGVFPKVRHYPNSNKSFWLASEVRVWMQRVLDALAVAA